MNDSNGPDVLVNNAGIAGPTAPVETVDPEKWEAVINIDVVGYVSRDAACHPTPEEISARSIISMSSLGGRFGYPNRSAYCTAKMGLITFATRTIEHRVNAIAPGAVRRARIDRVLEGRAQAENKTLEEVRTDAGVPDWPSHRFVRFIGYAAFAVII